MKRIAGIGVAVAAGGAIGTLGRFLVFAGVESAGAGPRWSLLFVNLAGAFLLGWYVSRMRLSGVVDARSLAFVGVGLLGSFTTFSGFTLEAIEQVRAGQALGAAVFVVSSIVGGAVLATVGGMIPSR